MKIAICDDSQHDIYLINKYVHEYMVANYLDIELYSFQSGAELLTSIKATPFDIVFLIYFSAIAMV